MRFLSDCWGRSRFRIALLATVAGTLLAVAGSEPTPEVAAIPLAVITPTTPTVPATSTTTSTVATRWTADSGRQPIPRRRSVVATSTTSTPAGVRCPEMWPIVSAVFPADEWANADYVAYRESGCRPDVVRAGADWGLYQINKAAHSRWIYDDWGYTMGDLLNPEKNAFVAFLIWLRGVEYTGCGWSAWYMSIDPEALC